MADNATGDDGPNGGETPGPGAAGRDDADRARDAERLAALEARLAARQRDDRPATPGADKFHHANQAWRMVVELVAGLVIGCGVGYGLDWLLGTAPIMLIVFVFLGFAAGVKTMLRTAAEMGGTAREQPPAPPAKEQTPAEPAGGQKPAQPAGGQKPAKPAGTKGTERGD